MNLRIRYIDIAKGLLIISVVFWHSICTVEDSPTLRHLHIFTANTLLPFFMQAFFVITGYCSNFYKSFHKHIWDDFRTLILPAILLSIVIKGFEGELNWKSAFDSIILLSGAWFVIALFFCKAFNWVLFRIEKNFFSVALFVNTVRYRSMYWHSLVLL